MKSWHKLHSRKARDDSGNFLVEGFHLVEEALRAKVVSEVIFCIGARLPTEWDVSGVSLFEVNEPIAEMLSQTKVSQHVFAVCRKQVEYLDWQQHQTFLLVDALQDPGNLGSIIRTADAVGVDAVILGEGCVDVYNDKTIRATQGSLFHLPVISANLQAAIAHLKKQTIPVFGTALTNGQSVFSLKAPSRFALIVGNEGSGVSRQLLQEADQSLFVPMRGQAESLNVSVATAVLLYHLIEHNELS